MLDIGALKKFLTYAYEDGFNNISVSGGEPFLYTDLEELFKFTRLLGYQNTMASNGMLLTSEKNKRILQHVDLIAVSVDGKPELHDYIRGQKGAFEKMLKGVAVLQELQKPFGFIHTVTQKSWDSLLWLGEFAFEQGAKLLQLHPLEMHGRALEKLSDGAVDDTLAHQTFILANYLRSKYSDKMVVQVDLLHRDYLETFPQTVNTFERACATNEHLSTLFDTIIIEETGKVLPVAYGFNSKFTIGNVHTFHQQLFEEFIAEKVIEIKSIFYKTMNKIVNNKEIDIINWNEMLVDESRKVSLVHKPGALQV
jgi:MoaA/NifB/PqqE/SkfB family radical SAM enzyme